MEIKQYKHKRFEFGHSKALPSLTVPVPSLMECVAEINRNVKRQRKRKQILWQSQTSNRRKPESNLLS